MSKKAIIFLAAWFLLALVQNAFTNLTSDEGYYWFLSRHLQWGYYDHPPITMLMIDFGYSLFSNELGVRLVNAILSTGSFFLFLKLLPKTYRNSWFTYLILLAQPLLQYFSIIVFPDTPLLFFGLLYLTGYKRIIEKKDVSSFLLMGISLAGMFYSKYYGVLFLAFTILSNPGILKIKWFWISLLIPILISVPHLLWQYENGFPSFKYHLEKRASGFSFRFLGEFISQQIPAISPAFIIVVFIYKVKDQFEKTLKFIAIGTMLFFLLNSFRGFVHFHWTSVALFPLMFLAIKYYSEKRKLFNWLATPIIVCIILFRIHVLFPFLPFKANDLGYYKDRDTWAKQISSIAGNDPVLFYENFREAGLYTFYTGKMGVPLFDRSARQTQYDLWGYEDSLQSKNVLLVRKRYFKDCKELASPVGKTIYYKRLDNFESYNNIPVGIKIKNLQNDSLFFEMKITNTRSIPLTFPMDEDNHYPGVFISIRNKKNELIKSEKIKELPGSYELQPGKSIKLDLSFSIIDLSGGEYFLDAGFYYKPELITINSTGNLFTVN